MLLFKDAISGDELLTDSYKMKLIDDVLYVVEGKYTTEKGGIDESLLGANKSAEEQDDGGCDDGETKGIDVVMAGKLQEIPYTKKEYLAYMKEFVKKIKARKEECMKCEGKSCEEIDCCIKEWQERFNGQVKVLLKDFSELLFFTGESCNEKAHVALMKYSEDGMSATVYFWKDALIEEKC